MWGMKQMPIQDYAFFDDESGISNDRYTVVSGLTIHRSVLPTVLSTISAFRRANNMNAELKWSKVSNQKEGEYRELINTFFALNNAKLIEFHDPPPLKWSSAMFRKTEETHGKQATKARRDCHEVTAG